MLYIASRYTLPPFSVGVSYVGVGSLRVGDGERLGRVQGDGGLRGHGHGAGAGVGPRLSAVHVPEQQRHTGRQRDQLELRPARYCRHCARSNRTPHSYAPRPRPRPRPRHARAAVLVLSDLLCGTHLVGVRVRVRVRLRAPAARSRRC